MNQRVVAGVLVAIGVMTQAGGCAWLFQDKLPNGYEGYSGRSEPQCSTGSGWVVVDAVFAGLNTIGALAAASDDTNPNQGLYLISGVGWALIHTASAFSGSRWAGECRKAHADWNNDETPADSLERAAPARPRTHEPPREHTLPASAPPPVAPVTTPEPRGFYCAASPSAQAAALCAREKAACAEARGAVLGALPDLGPCALVETAFCFDGGTGNELERCAPTEAGCTAQRTAMGVSVGACVEQR